MLSLEKVNAYYGKAQVLHEISIRVGRGEIVSLIGRNGAGKSTTLKTMIGLLPCASGKRMLDGQDVHSYEGPLAEPRWHCLCPRNT